MADYDVIGRAYARRRRSDPRIARAINSALGGARSVLNVGAGTGSYELADRAIVAVEPSLVMIGLRRRRRSTGIGTAAGAVVGGQVGGKKGALIGGGAGAAGGTAYHYHKKRQYRRRHRAY